jgi:hypothetical protein
MVPLREPSRWPLAAIQAGAGLFIVALVISVLFDPAIWLLHTLQALIYVAVIVLARRNSAWGFGAGFTIALLWNSVNLFGVFPVLCGHRLKGPPEVPRRLDRVPTPETRASRRPSLRSAAAPALTLGFGRGRAVL